MKEALMMIIFFTLMATATKAQNEEPYTHNPIELVEESETEMTFLWVNLMARAPDPQTINIETEAGMVTFLLHNTPNWKKDKEEAADRLEIILIPDGWISVDGWELIMYENEHGHFKLIKWEGS